jgi:hypothetical protein
MAHLGENSTHDLLCTHPSLLLHIHDRTTEMSFSLKRKKLIKTSKVQAYESTFLNTASNGSAVAGRPP